MSPVEAVRRIRDTGWYTPVTGRRSEFGMWFPEGGVRCVDVFLIFARPLFKEGLPPLITDTLPRPFSPRRLPSRGH